jgi:hypothetical protein
MGLVHHTDAEREWAYDRKSHGGRLDKALDEANARGWTVVDMKHDWKVIYPFQRSRGADGVRRDAAIVSASCRPGPPAHSGRGWRGWRRTGGPRVGAG